MCLTSLKPALLAQNLGPPVVSQLCSAWGYKTLQVKFGKTRFNHQFLLAYVANPVLGMDFFTKFNLLLYPPTHQVLFALSLDNILQTGTPQGPLSQFCSNSG